jgi:putative transcriptional regulator
MSRAPERHPSDETLLRYSAGTLPPRLALVVAVHVPLCRDCQRAVSLGEALGGALLEDVPGLTLRDDALTRTLARLDDPIAATAPAPESFELGPGVRLPDPLLGLVRPAWRLLGPGLRRMTVRVPVGPPGEPREQVHLLRVAPGVGLPDHGHEGWEAACVLSGSFSDETGVYRAGDVAETEAVTMHRPVAGADEACICLIAWQGRLRMRGWLGRMAGPLLGI